MKIRAEERKVQSTFRILLFVLNLLASHHALGSCSETIKEEEVGKVEYFTSCHASYKYFEYHVNEIFEDSTTNRFIDLRVGTSKAICEMSSNEVREQCFTKPLASLDSNSKYFIFYDQSTEWSSRDYEWSYDLPDIYEAMLNCAVGVAVDNTVHIFVRQDGYTNFIDCILPFDDYLSHENTELNLILRRE